MKKEKRNYEYIHRTISQPVDHSDPNGVNFNQHLDIIIPEGCSSNAPVFFHLGEEHELEELRDTIYRSRGGEISHPLLDAMRHLKKDIKRKEKSKCLGKKEE